MCAFGLAQLSKPYEVSVDEFEKRAQEGPGLLGAGLIGIQKALDPAVEKAVEAQEDLRQGRYDGEQGSGEPPEAGHEMTMSMKSGRNLVRRGFRPREDLKLSERVFEPTNQRRTNAKIYICDGRSGFEPGKRTGGLFDWLPAGSPRIKSRTIKLDPYINVDPGTMSPFQHGEVFVTDDGAETDLDLAITSASLTPTCPRRTTGPPVASIFR